MITAHGPDRLTAAGAGSSPNHDEVEKTTGAKRGRLGAAGSRLGAKRGPLGTRDPVETLFADELVATIRSMSTCQVFMHE